MPLFMEWHAIACPTIPPSTSRPGRNRSGGYSQFCRGKPSVSQPTILAGETRNHTGRRCFSALNWRVNDSEFCDCPRHFTPAMPPEKNRNCENVQPDRAALASTMQLVRRRPPHPTPKRHGAGLFLKGRGRSTVQCGLPLPTEGGAGANATVVCGVGNG